MGEKNPVDGFIHRLLIFPVGYVDTGGGLQRYSDYYLKIDLYNSIWFLTYKILLSKDYDNKGSFLKNHVPKSMWEEAPNCCF